MKTAISIGDTVQHKTLCIRGVVKEVNFIHDMVLLDWKTPPPIRYNMGHMLNQLEHPNDLSLIVKHEA